MRIFLPLLLFVGACIAASMPVPAVSDGDYGSLVWMHVDEVPGKGGVYVSVRPLAGESLQSSIKDSVACASSRGNDFSSSLLLVGTDAPEETGVLDGPSAGVALTSLLLSMRDGSALRNDTSVTGGITPSCGVLQVGGLAEKAEAAHSGGVAVLLVPKAGPEEAALLDRLHAETGVAVHEYESLDEAYALLTSREKTGHNVSYGNASYLGGNLGPVEGNPALEGAVGGMAAQLGREADEIPQGLTAARSYYANKSALVSGLYSKGYSYSAGNEAFLALVALAPLTRGLDDRSISALSYDAHSCVGRASAALDAGSLDVEHFSNAELRIYWASRELSQHKRAPETLSQRMRRVQSLERALLWCRLAEGIIGHGNGSGGTNVSRLEEVASALVKNYSKSGPATGSLADAQDALQNGSYGAALVLVSMHESQVSSEQAANYTPERAWSRMLAHHSGYLDSNTDYGEDGGNGIMLLAMMLDRHFAEVERGGSIIMTEVAGNGSTGNMSGPASDAHIPVGNGSAPAIPAQGGRSTSKPSIGEGGDMAQQERITLLIFAIICILLAFAIALRALRNAARR